MKRYLLALIGVALVCVPAFGQQSGSMSGKVTLEDGSALPGVLVTASGDVLPQSRTATTSTNGEYRFPLLPPGNYDLTFASGGMAEVTRPAKVLLQQNTFVNVVMAPEAIEETLEVVAETPLIDQTSAEIKGAIDDTVIRALPVGQEYRDLVKLIPGVQYTEDAVRGPSAGASGQDNVYLFDGVNVNLPLFGTLSAEPSSHDVEQVSVIKGGAKAIDFNRAAGFTINTISKSGTNNWRGEVSYQVQSAGMTGDLDTESTSEFDEDKDWTVANIGGPVVREKLFFYASYYRPTVARGNRSNNYGEVPNLDDTRDELFGKLSYTPTDSLWLNGSYRDSDHTVTGSGVSGDSYAGSTSNGSDATLGIAILEGNWVINENSTLFLKFNDFENLTAGRPDNLFDFQIAADGSVPLNVGALDTQGLFHVPQPIDGENAYNQFIQPLIDQYGYVDESGNRVGGGYVGGDNQIDAQDFARQGFQIGYDYFLQGDSVSHDLHVGFQTGNEEMDISRTSNGWGTIEVIGGRDTASDGTPIFYEARFEQQSLIQADGTLIPPIHAEFESQSIELNDNISWGDWSFNIGVLLNNDKLYGQGLRENSSNVSGFELAPGNKYLMKEIDFDEMIQPRLGAVWGFNATDTVYASYARYYPAASSLPWAASWSRNLRRSIRGYFDAAGNLIETDPVGSSSGKFFQEGISPRYIDELIVGYSSRLSDAWTGKTYVRYNRGRDFWEDTNNNARSRFEPPPGVPTEDYIPELGDYRDEVGGSSYVIAQLDGAYTEFWEANFDFERRGRKTYFKGSYVWSHYYGNFDQDNTTTGNDANIFIGSSFLADGAGRQVWDFREGNLRGDRRNQLKAYGYYNFNWDGSTGFYAVYQSGQPWEEWNVEVYRHLTGSSSDTSRYAEPAGSRTTDAHYQIDLNYTHNFRFKSRYNIQLRADIFNITDNQTGYNIQNKFNSADFGVPRSYFDPRRLQLAVKFQF